MTQRLTDRIHTPQPVREAVDTSREFVMHNPASSAFLAFGIGLGVGLAAVVLLSDTPRRQECSTHELGRRVLDALAGKLPPSWTNG